MKLRLGLLALAVFVGGSAAPAPPKPPGPAEARTVTCAYGNSGAICRVDEASSWPEGAVYRVP
jgi:hypothetical protein